MNEIKPPRGDTPAVDIVRYALLSVALGVGSLLLLPFYGVTLVVLPLPSLVATMRYGAKAGVVVAVATSAPVALLAGPSLGAPVLLATLALGLGQALLTRAGMSAGRVLTICIGVFVAIAAVGVLALFATKTVTVAQLHQFALLVQKELVRYGGTVTFESANAARAFRELYVYMMPSGIVVLCLVGGLANFLAAQLLLRSRGLPSVALPPFRDWQVPWYLSWGFIAGLACAVGYRYLDGQTSKTIMYLGYNFVVVFGALYMVQGLAVVVSLFERFHVRPALRGGLLAVAIFLQLIVQALSWVGLLDTWFNYRKLEREE